MSTPSVRPPRTALCLCGGGMTGGMYEIGALAALDDFLAPREGAARFRVNDFDLFVGTSAGALLATIIAGGLQPGRLYQAVLEDDPTFHLARRTDVFRFDLRQGLGILRDVAGIALSGLAQAARGRFEITALLSDFSDALPAGVFSLRHYESFLQSFLRHHQLPMRFEHVPRELYITANDLDSGHRVILGHGELADMPLARAICASSAIPLFFEPVRFRGRDFVDGAVGKVEHADIALARGAELIIVVNPLVPFKNDPGRDDLPTPIIGARHLRDKGMLAVYQQAAKMSTRTKLHQGIRRYRASHPHATFLVIEPSEEEADLFLHNPMSFSSRRRILQFGYESTTRLLEAQRDVYESAFARHAAHRDAEPTQDPGESLG